MAAKSKEKKPTKKVKKTGTAPKAGGVPMVKVTLEDGNVAFVPANTIKSAEQSAKKKGFVVFTSVDNRELEVSIGSKNWVGKQIKVPANLAEDVERLLKDGGFYFR